MKELKSLITSLPILFTLGLLSSLSPCLFPIFSTFLGYITNAEKSVYRGILTGFACLLGIALSFSIYGIFASLLFSILIEYNIILRSVFGIIIILFGIAMYTQKIQVFICAPKKLLTFRGYLGVFILGLSYTLIAAPCAMPMFMSALIAATGSGNMLLTVISLLVFSVGAALPFLVSPLLVLGTKNILRNQYLAFAKWFKVLSSFILILTGLLLLLPMFGLPSVFY